MKKIVVMIVFSLSLFLGPTAVSGFYNPETTDMEVTGVIENGEYTEDVIITFTEFRATLDDYEIENGTIVTEIGNHVLVVYNSSGVPVEVIHFTILPRFTNPIDLSIYYNSLEIILENEGTMTLNGEVITEPVTLEQVGNHILVIDGVDGYSRTYNFEIKNQLVDYLRDFDMYQDFTIDVSCFKEVYYENELQTEDFLFDKIGTYEITVVDFDDNEETIEFDYAHSSNRIEHGGVYSNSLLIEKGTAEKWYIDNVEQKQSIDSLYITTVGKHVVKYVGQNNYLRYYTITITEGDIGIEDGDVFEDFFQYKFTGYNVYLNGVKYTSNKQKSGAGYYTMEVKGVNGYSNTYQIFINEEVPFEKLSITDPPQVIDESITLNQDFKKIYVNGKEEENFRFSESGEYRIVYLGDGGYIDAYTVIYENQHESVNSTIFQGIIGLGALVGIAYVFVAWRRFK